MLFHPSEKGQGLAEYLLVLFLVFLAVFAFLMLCIPSLYRLFGK